MKNGRIRRMTDWWFGYKYNDYNCGINTFKININTKLNLTSEIKKI